jgi:hypothetical protein
LTGFVSSVFWASGAFSIGSFTSSGLLFLGAELIFEDWSKACSFLSITSWLLALGSERLEEEYGFDLE